ncbi:DUF6676 family protein [Pseudonocardia kongjuensis]|uniref:Rv1476 family membrane protein n=1 Tax=Pseudonocardia kongjuensis TaxID=102227 RepID=UPI0031E26980
MLSLQPQDADAILDDLADNGVAAPGDQSELAAVVQSAAADHDLALSVVVVPQADSQAELVQLAQTVRSERGGTVLVLSPEYTAAASDSYTDVDAYIDGLPGSDVAAAEQFVGELTDPGPPWLGIGIVAVLLVALVAGGGRWWELRRRRRRDAAALAAEGERLRGEVAEMADEMLSIESRTALLEDAGLGTEYSTVAVEYRDVVHQVERDPRDRRAANALAGRVRALHDRVQALDLATRP